MLYYYIFICSFFPHKTYSPYIYFAFTVPITSFLPSIPPTSRVLIKYFEHNYIKIYILWHDYSFLNLDGIDKSFDILFWASYQKITHDFSEKKKNILH